VESCIYEGVLRHRRFLPNSHSFDYKLFMMYLDLDELDDVLGGRLIWSHRRPAPARFKRSDYLGDCTVPLKQAVRQLARERLGIATEGPIRLLTHLRYFGYCFNPVSFYFLFDSSGRHVEQIVAEINNTPWDERYSYVLGEEQNLGTETKKRYRFAKDFHVSPFMGMDVRYDWFFTEPSHTLSIHMENLVGDTRTFDATLSLRRTEITSASMTRVLVQYPLVTLKVFGAIYWNAFRLWRKRIPFYPHPDKVHPRG